MINIIKVNNIKIKIESNDFDFLLLLRDKFSFLSDGYQFKHKFKNKQWDGKIHLLRVDGTMPYGLYNYVIKICRDYNKPYTLDQNIKNLTIPVERLSGIVKRLDIHIDGESITPHYYQEQAVHYALENQRCLLISPTSSGKSLIIYLLIRIYLQMYKERILILVPNVGLISQLTNDFKDYSSANGFNVDDSINGICKGKLINNNRIIIATWQSLSNKQTKPSLDFFSQFKVVINDEVHLSTAKTLQTILNSCVNADTRIGLTGTLKDAKANALTLMGLFGTAKDVITTKELMEQNKIANLSIEMITLKHNEQQCKFMRSSPRGEVDKTGKKKRLKADYNEEIAYILCDQQRNNYCINLCRSLKGNTILMIHKVDHGIFLFERMKELYPDKHIYLYNGSVKKEQREEIRTVMELENNAIIIGSMKTISTGISIKRLHNLILCHPTKSKITVLQSIGRILRKSSYGNSVKLYDIVDDFSIGAYTNYVLEHGKIRYEHYNNQLFNVEIRNLELK